MKQAPPSRKPVQHDIPKMVSVVTYAWTSGTRRTSDQAPIVGAFLDKLQDKHNSRLSPRIVVEAARPLYSPIHSLFEWDDTIAAEAWRDEQAREILRHLVVRYIDQTTDTAQEIRAFVSLVPPDSGDTARRYIPVFQAMSDNELRRQLLEQALHEAESWRRRYDHLVEMVDIVRAIGKVAKRLQHL